LKTLFKILRSTVTSLLFILLTIALSIEFIFLFIRSENGNLKNLIDQKVLLEILVKETPTTPSIKKVLTEYIDDQLNYIFYATSYP